MRLRILLGLVAGAFIASCGSDSPTSSTSTTAPATIQGTVTAGTANGGLTALSGHSPSASAAGITVSVMGASLSTTTDSSGHFILMGITSDHVTLHFQGPGIDATLEITGLQPGQTLTINVHVSGDQATRDEDNEDPNTGGTGSGQGQCVAAGAKAEVEGHITAKGSADITVAQEGKGNYLCQVSATTRIRHGNKTFAFSDLKVGDHVHVSGTGLGSSGGVCGVAADEVKIQ